MSPTSSEHFDAIANSGQVRSAVIHVSATHLGSIREPKNA